MAKKVVGELATIITARDAGFTAELRKMQNQIARVQAQTGSLSRGFRNIGPSIVSSLATPIAALVTLQGTVQSVIGQISEADNLKDAASAIGLGAEELSGLRYAAKFSGVEVAALDKSLGRLINQVQNAKELQAAGKGSIFTRLGLDPAAMSRVSVQEQFFQVSDAIARLGSANERAAATADIFGERQTRLAAVIGQGSAAIRAYIKEAERLGGIVTSKQADAAERMADAAERYKASWGGFVRGAMGAGESIQIPRLLDAVGSYLNNPNRSWWNPIQNMRLAYDAMTAPSADAMRKLDESEFRLAAAREKKARETPGTPENDRFWADIQKQRESEIMARRPLWKALDSANTMGGFMRSYVGERRVRDLGVVDPFARQANALSRMRRDVDVEESLFAIRQRARDRLLERGSGRGGLAPLVQAGSAEEFRMRGESRAPGAAERWQQEIVRMGDLERRQLEAMRQLLRVVESIANTGFIPIGAI